MKAHVIYAFGEPNEFRTIDIPRASIGEGEVRVKVRASSVNAVDWKIRRGIAAVLAPDFPAVLHGDVAGVVEEVGIGVRQFKPGDEVYGCAGGVKGLGGALAEYMSADAKLLAHKPASLSMREAATLPLVSITAWEGLIERAAVKPGQRVLVHAGAGGVGHIAVQLAKWAGAEVYSTVSSTEKMEVVRRLGADAAINYKDQTVSDYVQQYTDGKGFDIVFDTVGGENLDASFQAAAVNGAVVSISTHSTHDLSLLHQKGLSLHVVFMLIPMLHNQSREKHGRILRNIADLVDAGKIRPLLDKQGYSFEEASLAHRRLESGEAIGKVALECSW